MSREFPEVMEKYLPGASKLTYDQVEAIRRKRGVVTYKELAHEYGVCMKTIFMIMTNRRYKDPSKGGTVCPKCGIGDSVSTKEAFRMSAEITYLERVLKEYETHYVTPEQQRMVRQWVFSEDDR